MIEALDRAAIRDRHERLAALVPDRPAGEATALAVAARAAAPRPS